MLNKMGWLVLAIVSFSSVGQAAPSTKDIWEHHIQAWSARDLEGIVADYSDESVVLASNKFYRGQKEIRELFTKLFRIFDGANDHVVDPAILTSRLVYITWRARINNTPIPLGADTFVIEDGKIVYQTITSHPSIL